MPTFIKDLFDLTDVVRACDFVLRLVDGLERPEQPLRDCVVTPQLDKCFDETIWLVRDALEGRTSKARYLLGSFGGDRGLKSCATPADKCARLVKQKKERGIKILERGASDVKLAK
jgi:hypothetical protein